MPTARRAPRNPCDVQAAPRLVALAALSAAVMWSLLAQGRPAVPSPDAGEIAPAQVDPNSATPAQLEGLPGIGPAKLARYGDAFLRALREPA